MDFIRIENIIIDVEFKKIKNIHLTVYPPNGRVHISAPMSMTKDAIRLFAIDKLDWIKKRIKLVIESERQGEREYVSGENHYFKGIRYRLNVIYGNEMPRVELKGTKFINLYVRDNASVIRREEIIKDWHRRELKDMLKPLVEKWERVLDVKADDWDVLQMKTMWGSCNNKTKKILFNLELIKKPTHCIDYIVLHELTHLIERLHSDRFISILDKHMPSWRQIKDELNTFIV